MNFNDSARNFETCLARLYTDGEFRRKFVAAPKLTLEEYRLAKNEIHALLQIDLVGLELAAQSFQAKRDSYMQKKESRRTRSWVFRAQRWLNRQIDS